MGARQKLLLFIAGVSLVSLIAAVFWPETRVPYRESAIYEAGIDGLIIRHAEQRKITSDEFAKLIATRLSGGKPDDRIVFLREMEALVALQKPLVEQQATGAPAEPAQNVEAEKIRWNLGLWGEKPMTDKEYEILMFTWDVVDGEYDNSAEVSARNLADFALEKSGYTTVDQFSEKINAAANATPAASQPEIFGSPELQIQQPAPPTNPPQPTEITEPRVLREFREPVFREPIDDTPRGSIGIEREAGWMREVLEKLPKD